MASVDCGLLRGVWTTVGPLMETQGLARSRPTRVSVTTKLAYMTNDPFLDSASTSENDRSWITRGRGRTGGLPGSGANALPIGRQPDYGRFQERSDAINANQSSRDTITSLEPDDGVSNLSSKQAQNLNERNSWGSSPFLSKSDETEASSSLGDLETNANSIRRDSGDWKQSPNKSSLALLSSSDEDNSGEASEDWVSGTSAGDGWPADSRPSVAVNNDELATDDSITSLETRRPRRHGSEPECKDIDALVWSMRQILFNLEYKMWDRVSEEDDAAVQAVLVHHPDYTEKRGCGIAYIMVGRSPVTNYNRCFWLVRTDGSAIDFSFHKCLKERVAKEFPAFAEWYDDIYCSKWRSRSYY